MRFARAIWKLLVGIKDALVLLLMLLFFGLLYAGLSADPTRSPTACWRSTSRGQWSSSRPRPTVRSLAGGGRIKEYRLRDLVAALDEARTDDRVKAVALDLDGFLGGGQTAMADLSDAVRRVRERPASRCSPTPPAIPMTAICSARPRRKSGSTRSAPSASPARAARTSISRACSTSSASPPTSIASARYKAAVEPFIRNDMSPEARENYQAFGRGPARKLARDRARGRGPRPRSTAYLQDMPGAVDAAGGDMAKAALAAGLVDKIAERRAYRSPAGRARRRGRRCAAADTAGSSSPPTSATRSRAGPRARSASSPSPARSSTARRPRAPPAARASPAAIEKGLREGGLKALVVRVDSPGGSVLASERIRQAHPRRQGEGPARRRLDGQRRGIGRLLGGDPGRLHLRRAVDHHRLDRRVRHPAQLRGDSGQARNGRRRHQDDAAVRRAGLAQGPVARGRPADPGLGRIGLSPLPRRSSPSRGASRRPKSTGSPRAGCGTAAPRASSAWSTASAAWRKRSPRRPSWPSSTRTTVACATSSGRRASRKACSRLARRGK